MTWEDKTSMVNAHNFGDNKAFKYVVLNHIHEFDSQAMDMFINCCELTKENIESDPSFFASIKPHLYKQWNLGMTSSIRLEYLKSIL